ncbi:MAG: TolC family protein [Bacteroides sp.]|nr:TolC family protein [Bacteroides sp.]
MKQLLIFIALLFLCTESRTQSIEEVLQSIERNNKELQAYAQITRSKKLEVRAENNLPDPTLSYAHLWNNKDKNNTIGELVIAQSFDFPATYFSRHKLNRLKMSVYDTEAESMRRELLLQAKELCLDIILLRRQQDLLDIRRSNAQELSGIYQKKLQAGDANILERNKINLELLNIKTESTLNEAALHTRLQELQAMNGGIPIQISTLEYPRADLPGNYEELRREIVEKDPLLRSLNNESERMRQQVKVNQAGWFPRFELGYRRNTESGEPFNGVVVGFSFPLFENRGKVRSVKAERLGVDLQKENTRIRIRSEIDQYYQEATQLYQIMREYEETLEAQSDLTLLRKALDGGQISMIEYFIEAAGVYQSRETYLQLENQYQKTLAKIFSNEL